MLICSGDTEGAGLPSWHCKVQLSLVLHHNTNLHPTPIRRSQETSKVSTLDYQKGGGNNGPHVSAAWQKAPWKAAGPFYPGLKTENLEQGHLLVKYV